MTEHPDDLRMTALVDADLARGADVPPPDLAALRAGGRRLARRRRLTVAAAAAVAALLVVPATVGLLGHDEGSSLPQQPAGPSASDVTTSAAPTPTPDEEPRREPRPPRPRQVDVPLDNGLRAAAEWEDGALLGEQVVVDTYGGRERVLYAVRSAGGGPDSAYVGVGLRYRGGLARLVGAISPLRARAPDGTPVPDGVELWGGGRRELDGSQPSYLVVGAVPGDVDVRLTAPGQALRAVTGSSTKVLPGFTVFFDRGPWDDTWDVLRLAPLTVEVGGGRSVEVRERSYES